MSINRLYHSWSSRIRQLIPGLRITQHRNLVWLLVGIYLSHSVHLSRIAGKLPGRARQLSVTRRLSRFLASPIIRVRPWYRPVAQHWLQAQARTTGEIRLILDGTKVGAAHQLLLVALAFRKRALPIAWTWVPYVKGYSPLHQQLALLQYVRGMLPAGVPVLVVGDSEFGSVGMLRQLDGWGWSYVLHQPGKNYFQVAGRRDWQHIRDLGERAGQSRWLGQGKLTAQFAYPINLLVYWQTGEEEPWLLATNLPGLGSALRAYRRRAWIEETFGDLKDNGFDLESSHLHSFIRLSRLTLVVALLYAWLVSNGVKAIKDGLRSLVDRTDRRDLSLFQIGWRMINRRLVNQQPVSVSVCLSYVPKLSGS